MDIFFKIWGFAFSIWGPGRLFTAFVNAVLHLGVILPIISFETQHTYRFNR